MAVQKTYSSEKEIAEIWKLFRETDRKMQETREHMKAMSAEADQRDRRMKELNELFIGQWGKLMESLVEGDLVKLLQERQIPVEATLTNLTGRYKGKETEFDIIAVNGEEIVVVEVKTTLNRSDVKSFIRKLEEFKNWRPEYKDKKVYGAVAYLKVKGGSKSYAEEQKLFVIRAVGSSASITNAKDFKPRSFS